MKRFTLVLHQGSYCPKSNRDSEYLCSFTVAELWPRKILQKGVKLATAIDEVRGFAKEIFVTVAQKRFTGSKRVEVWWSHTCAYYRMNRTGRNGSRPMFGEAYQRLEREKLIPKDLYTPHVIWIRVEPNMKKGYSK